MRVLSLRLAVRVSLRLAACLLCVFSRACFVVTFSLAWFVVAFSRACVVVAFSRACVVAFSRVPSVRV